MTSDLHLLSIARPLYRSTIGFDRLFSMQDQVPGCEIQNYPPHNIERIDENSYPAPSRRPVFQSRDLSIEVKENALVLVGEKKVADGEHPTEMVCRGTAASAFERRFSSPISSR